jgi:hypothetical protein
MSSYQPVCVTQTTGQPFWKVLCRVVTVSTNLTIHSALQFRQVAQQTRYENSCIIGKFIIQLIKGYHTVLILLTLQEFDLLKCAVQNCR